MVEFRFLVFVYFRGVYFFIMFILSYLGNGWLLVIVFWGFFISRMREIE